MMGFRTLLLTLLASYGAGVLAVRWFNLHALALDGAAIVSIVAVPIVQAVVLIGWRRISAARRRP